MLRLGLCCIFRQAPIRFRRTTATALFALPRGEQLDRLGALCLANARALGEAIAEVRRLGFGAFRVSSPLFPLYTHPQLGYGLDDLARGAEIGVALEAARQSAAAGGIRLSFHPDQFTLLSSPRAEVTAASIRELDYQALLAERIGADTITIHGGGAYGDQPAARERIAAHFRQLPERVKARLTLENDDRTYTVRDLLPLCEQLRIPLVYDVHHHRCHPDGLSVAEATTLSLATWERVGREAYFHLSSPKHGWQGAPRPHADFIDLDDFPPEWRHLDATVDVEAKAKEEAVQQLQRQLGLPPWSGDLRPTG